jgi:hypothetical protein
MRMRPHHHALNWDDGRAACVVPGAITITLFLGMVMGITSSNIQALSVWHMVIKTHAIYSVD